MIYKARIPGTNRYYKYYGFGSAKNPTYVECELGWHVVGDTLSFTGEDTPDDGVVLGVRGSLMLCENGLHYSRRVTDAFEYAGYVYNKYLCRVLVEKAIYKTDKGAALYRTILWRIPVIDLFNYVLPGYDFNSWRVRAEAVKSGEKVLENAAYDVYIKSSPEFGAVFNG